MPFCNNTIAQEVFQQNADSLFDLQAYQKAALAYEYQLFSCNNDSNKAILLFKKADCYKQAHQYDKALYSFNRIDTKQLNDSFYQQLLFEKAFCSYLIEDYDNTVYYLKEYREFYPKADTNRLLLSIEILALQKQQNFVQAKSALKSFDSLYPLPLPIDSFYTALANELAQTNLHKSKTRSKIYPGFGLLYLKNKKLGVSNLLIQGGLLTYTGFSFASGMYLNGLYGANLIFRFYTGQIKRTRIWAEHRQKEINNQYFTKLKITLLTKF